MAIGPSEVAADEAKRWWNCKDTPLLDDLVTAAPRLRLGKVFDDDFDDLPGPARRVFSLLFSRGTMPAYVVPRLNDELAREILTAYQGRDGDAPATQRARLAEVAAFLAAHQGDGLLTVLLTSSAPACSGGPFPARPFARRRPTAARLGHPACGALPLFPDR